MEQSAAGAPRINFGKALREARKSARLTQEELGRMLPVARETVSQWESGKYRPSASNIRKLDELLRADQTLIRLAGEDTEPGTVDTPARQTLHDILLKMRRQLTRTLIEDEDGHPIGWGRDFVATRATPLSTATGIRLLSIVEAPEIDLHLLAQSLVGMEEERGGWQARGIPGRPEVTSAIAASLASIGSSQDIDRLVLLAEEQSDEQILERSYVLAEIVYSLGQLRPRAEFVSEAVRRLLDMRRDDHSWPKKTLLRRRASTASTARSILALSRHLGALDTSNPEAEDAIAAASEWLKSNARLELTGENLEPALQSQHHADLEIRHFTGALVARALTVTGNQHAARTDLAVQQIWERFDPTSAMWLWEDGETPIWMQHEALAALTLLAHSREVVPASAGRLLDDDTNET